MTNEAGFAGHLRATDVPGDLHPLVYIVGPLFKCGMPVKIGTTGNIANRFVELQRCSPMPLYLFGVALGGRDRERELHREFRKYRMHGEWFRMTPSLRSRALAFQEAYRENMRRLASRDESLTTNVRRG